MPCPRCNSRKYIKSGFEEKRQRYACKKCNYHYSVKQKKGSASKTTKKLSLDMYLEGMGLRAIGRVLQVSHVSVGNWIEEFGEKLTAAQKEDFGDVDIMELDEVHTYLGLKKIISGYGLQ